MRNFLSQMSCAVSESTRLMRTTRQWPAFRSASRDGVATSTSTTRLWQSATSRLTAASYTSSTLSYRQHCADSQTTGDPGMTSADAVMANGVEDIYKRQETGPLRGL